jgi:hypothetical protein
MESSLHAVKMNSATVAAMMGQVVFDKKASALHKLAVCRDDKTERGKLPLTRHYKVHFRLDDL